MQYLLRKEYIYFKSELIIMIHLNDFLVSQYSKLIVFFMLISNVYFQMHIRKWKIFSRYESFIKAHHLMYTYIRKRMLTLKSKRQEQ